MNLFNKNFSSSDWKYLSNDENLPRFTAVYDTFYAPSVNSRNYWVCIAEVHVKLPINIVGDG